MKYLVLLTFLLIWSCADFLEDGIVPAERFMAAAAVRPHHVAVREAFWDCEHILTISFRDEHRIRAREFTDDQLLEFSSLTTNNIARDFADRILNAHLAYHRKKP